MAIKFMGIDEYGNKDWITISPNILQINKDGTFTFEYHGDEDLPQQKFNYLGKRQYSADYKDPNIKVETKKLHDLIEDLRGHKKDIKLKLLEDGEFLSGYFVSQYEVERLFDRICDHKPERYFDEDGDEMSDLTFETSFELFDDEDYEPRYTVVSSYNYNSKKFGDVDEKFYTEKEALAFIKGLSYNKI